ncbi:MAG: hypothetical protein HY553_11715 [Elusimicrobia bacterium]|nr:hypothetical protein [Elusimicrobiota bacterium]
MAPQDPPDIVSYEKPAGWKEWLRRKRKALAGAAGLVVLAIFLLSLVPLPEDQLPPAPALMAPAGPGVPRWSSPTMERSAPEALIRGFHDPAQEPVGKEGRSAKTYRAGYEPAAMQRPPEGDFGAGPPDPLAQAGREGASDGAPSGGEGGTLAALPSGGGLGAGGGGGGGGFSGGGGPSGGAAEPASKGSAAAALPRDNAGPLVRAVRAAARQVRNAGRVLGFARQEAVRSGGPALASGGQAFSGGAAPGIGAPGSPTSVTGASAGGAAITGGAPSAGSAPGTGGPGAGASSGGSNASTPPRPETPPAAPPPRPAVPQVGAAVTADRRAEAQSRADRPECLKDMPAGDVASWKCPVGTCLYKQLEDPFGAIFALATTFHGTMPRSVPGQPTPPHPRRNILGETAEHLHNQHTWIIQELDSLHQRVADLDFSDIPPEYDQDGNLTTPGVDLSGLRTCQSYVIRHVRDPDGAKEMVRRVLGVLVETATPLCGSYPVDEPEKSAKCHQGMTSAAGRDRNGVKGYIHNHLREGVSGLATCRAQHTGKQKEWNDFQDELRVSIGKIGNIVNVPLCGRLRHDLPAEIPDKFKRRAGERRLPCDPNGADMLRDAQRKLSKFADAAEVTATELAELVPPNSVAVFRASARDLEEAAEDLERYDHEDSVNLFDAAVGIDRALIKMKPVLDQWHAAKERACRPR